MYDVEDEEIHARSSALRQIELLRLAQQCNQQLKRIADTLEHFKYMSYGLIILGWIWIAVAIWQAISS